MGPFILRVISLVYLFGISAAQGKFASVGVNEEHQRLLSKCRFPGTLPVQIHIEDAILELNLMVNRDVSTQIPVYIMSESKGPVREHLDGFQTHQAYKDKTKMAAVVVTCLKDDRLQNFTLEGKITHGERVYAISPRTDHLRHPRDVHQTLYNHILTIPDVYSSSPISDSQYINVPDSFRRAKREDPKEILSRAKRRTPENFIIDIMVIADYTIYYEWHLRAKHPLESQKKLETYNNIRKYYVVAYNWVNLIYENFPALDFTIKINVAAILISETSSTSPWTAPFRVGSKVYGMNTLKAMQEWIDNNTQLPEYDHVQLFSRFDFCDDEALSTTANKGKSYIGSMCLGSRSISYVEELGGFNSADIAAHELGHSFGANHDGFSNWCDISSTDLMAVIFNPHIARSNTPSSCTMYEIKRYMFRMKDIVPECMFEPMRKDSDVPVERQFPGMVFNPDEQCRQVHGAKSFYCRNAVIDDANDFCYEDMYCYNPRTESCTTIVPALGTPCGNQSWCMNAECKHDERAPIRDSSCLFGDLPHGYYKLTDSGESCQQRVISAASECYDEFFRLMCCESCAKIKNEKAQDCEYGDHYDECYSFKCGTRIIIDEEEYDYNEICCDTCQQTTTVKTTQTTSHSIQTTRALTKSTTTLPSTTSSRFTQTTSTYSTSSQRPSTSSRRPSTSTSSTRLAHSSPTSAEATKSPTPSTSQTTHDTVSTTASLWTTMDSVTAFPPYTDLTTISNYNNISGPCYGRREYETECELMIKYGGDCFDFVDVCCETCKDYILDSGAMKVQSWIFFVVWKVSVFHLFLLQIV